MKRSKLLLSLASVATLAMVVACTVNDDTTPGGTSSSSSSGGTTDGEATPAEYTAALPTYDDSSVAMSDADRQAGRATSGDQGCHPHLFLRTRDAIRRYNRHIYRGLFVHLEGASARAAHARKDTAGTTYVWTETDASGALSGITRQISVTKAADASFSYKVGLSTVANAGDADSGAAFTTVASGTSSVSGDTSTRAFTIDFTALKTVIPAEKASGQVAYSVVRVKSAGDAGDAAAAREKRTFTINTTSFLFDDDAATTTSAAATARNASVTALVEPGVGGYIKLADELVLACPSNPNNTRANVTVLARWYTDAQRALIVRADASATGGQIDALDRWRGVTCGKAAAGADVTESYWAMKDQVITSGSTATGLLRSADDTAGNTATNACDPLFGSVMTLVDASADLNVDAPPAQLFPGQF